MPSACHAVAWRRRVPSLLFAGRHSGRPSTKIRPPQRMILAPITGYPNPDSRAGTTHNFMSKHASTAERFPRELATLRQLADGLPQIVWVARTDGSHEYYNKQWSDYTGLSLENSTDEAWRDLFHPDDRERAENLWAQA